MSSVEIPTKVLTNTSGQIKIPVVGMGSAPDFTCKKDTKEAIIEAIKQGYRHFDTAAAYGSEQALGEALSEAIQLGLVTREELFVTSKLWVTENHPHLVIPALQKSLKTLQLDYLDLYLIHWPLSSQPGKFSFPIDVADLLPFDVKGVWESLEEALKLGLTKAIGVSNFSVKKLQKLLSVATVLPAVNQLEMNPVSEGQTKKSVSSKSKILDPQGPMLQKWNKIFVITCVMAISVDPLFFYIPVIVGKNKCVDLDEALQTTASVLRTFFDLFYILRIIFQFRTGFIAPFSLVFGRGELVDDPVAIMKRYLSSHFIIDILSIIPLPQIICLAIFPHMKNSAPFVAKDLLKYAVLIQYVPRLLQIWPLFKEVTRTSGILTETAWAGAAYNLFLYMLASHMVGANWYILSVESQVRCIDGYIRRFLTNAARKIALLIENLMLENTRKS